MPVGLAQKRGGVRGHVGRFFVELGKRDRGALVKINPVRGWERFGIVERAADELLNIERRLFALDHIASSFAMRRRTVGRTGWLIAWLTAWRESFSFFASLITVMPSRRRAVFTLIAKLSCSLL